MRLSVLYGPSVANDFVVGSVIARRATLVIREHEPALSVVRRAWVRRRDPLAARVDKLAFFALYGIALRRGLERGLHERLGPHPPVPPGPWVARADDGLAIVRAAHPDLVLTLGTSILSQAWNDLGAPIVNVHVGIAPRYRGRFCWFWPLLEGHPEDVGVTLHLLTARVDAGPIVLQRRVPREALGVRSFADVLAAVTRLARELCEEFLAEPEPLLRSATAPSAAVASRPAYLEPGLTAYLRYARMLRREQSRGAPVQRRT
jgi:hypothetical protein